MIRNIQYIAILLLSVIFSSCVEEEVASDLKNSFMRYYGGLQSGEGHIVQQLTDGSYLIAGHTSNADSLQHNIYLLKVDAYGNLVWEKHFGGNADEKAYGMQVLSDGGAIIAGTRSSQLSGGNNNIVLLRTDVNGKQLWIKTIGENQNVSANHILVKNDGGYLISGSINQPLTALDLLFVTADKDGNNIKIRASASDGNQQALCAATAENGFVFIGSNAGGADVNGSSDILLASANSDKWLHPKNILSGAGTDYGKVIKALDDGSFICLATYATQSDSGNNLMLFKMAKTAADYVVVWSKRFGTILNNEAAALEVSSNGFAIVGNTTNADASTDILFVLTNTNGDEVYRKSIGGQGNQRAFGLCKTSDGGFVIAGSNENSGNSVLMLVKLRKPEL